MEGLLSAWLVTRVTSAPVKSLNATFLSPAQTLQVICLRLTCKRTFELLAMACNTGFNMLNILLAIL